MTLRAAVYARVSTDQQVDGTSLDGQLDHCRRRITADGWTLVGEYVDEGWSGMKASRPQLDELMRRVRAGELDAVVCWRLDRFGRSQRETTALLGVLDDHNCRLVSVTESFDSSTPSGRMLRSLLVTFAEYEHSAIVERMANGRLRRAEQGLYTGGGVPYGWRVERTDTGARLVLDDDEAAVLHRVMAMVLDEGRTTWDAARELNSDGVPRRTGSRWTHNEIRRTLAKNAHYTGRWRFRVKGVECDVPIPPLCDDTRLRQLHDWLAATAAVRPRRTAGPAFMLTGRLQCACGRPMHGVQPSERAPSYRCADNRTEAAVKCSLGTPHLTLVDQRVWAAVSGLLLDPARLRALATEAASVSVAARAATVESSRSLARRIARLEDGLADRLVAAVKAGLSESVVERTVRAAEAELDGLRTKLAQAKVWEAHATDMASTANRLDALVESARRTLADPTPALRRRVVELLDVRVRVEWYETCPTCAGSGVTLSSSDRPGWNGRGTPQPCPQCGQRRTIPVLTVCGSVPAMSSLSAPDVDRAGIPFRLVG